LNQEDYKEVKKIALQYLNKLPGVKKIN